MARFLSLDVQKFAANPDAPTVTNQGAAGAAARSWKIVAVAADGTKSAASTAGSTATGHASPDGTNFDRLTWPAVPGASSYEVWRTAGGATQGKIGATSGTTFDDTGLAGDGATAPTTNGTGYGAASRVDDLQALTAQVDGTFVATLQLQGRLDAAAGWLDVGSAQTAPAFVAIAQRLYELRVRMTAYTSGTAKVYVGGNGRV